MVAIDRIILNAITKGSSGDRMAPPASPSSAIASTSRKTLDDPSTDAHQELLTEHFGFHPRVFVDALVYAANEHLYSIGAQFEDFAKASLKAAARRAAKRQEGDQRSKEQKSREKARRDAHLISLSPKDAENLAEQGVHGVLTLLESALDHIFDLLELYCLKTVFGVRPSQASSITLQHHRNLDLRKAEERARDGAVLSAEEESGDLLRAEEELRRKIDNARDIKHALRLSNVAAEQNLARVRRLDNEFALLLGLEDRKDAAVFDASLPQTARKMCVDAEALLEALHALRSADPLGESLLGSPVQTKRARPSEHERRNVIAASGASDHEVRAWERGREAYINWEMERIIRSVKGGGDTTRADVTRHDEGNRTTRAGRKSMAAFSRASLAPIASGPRSNESPRSKRRRTTRYSLAEPAQVEEHQAAQIGETEEVEALVDRLQN